MNLVIYEFKNICISLSYFSALHLMSKPYLLFFFNFFTSPLPKLLLHGIIAVVSPPNIRWPAAESIIDIR